MLFCKDYIAFEDNLQSWGRNRDLSGILGSPLSLPAVASDSLQKTVVLYSQLSLGIKSQFLSPAQALTKLARRLTNVTFKIFIRPKSTTEHMPEI